MPDWHRAIEVFSPPPDLPRPFGVGCETRRDPSYAHPGATRPGPPYLCLQVTLSGEGRFRDGTGEHPLPAGVGFFCTVTDPAIAYYYPAEGRAPWTFVFMAIGGRAALGWGERLMRRHGHLYALPPSQPLVQRLLAFGSRPERVVHLPAFAAASLAMELFATLEAAHQDRPTTAARELLHRAIAYVQQQSPAPLTVGDLAGVLGVSREHLSRVFARELGMSAHTYLQRQRLRLACQWLKQPQRPIKEIARAAGYPGSPQFSRAFRQHLHMSPTAFRRGGTLPAF
jgi:AraC-like DNA-binding protein